MKKQQSLSKLKSSRLTRRITARRPVFLALVGVAWLYGADSATADSWSPTGAMATARNSHTATTLPNGKVLVAGGEGTAGGGNALASAELYDPTAGTWTSTGSMAEARRGQKAILLSNGKVLATGGSGDPSWIALAELFDPTAGAWTTAGSMATGRNSHTMTLLPDGRVLITGGYNGNSLASAELYDPTPGTWMATGSMASTRMSHTATLLPNGKVLVAGGHTFGGLDVVIAELYDPTAGTWTATGSMAVSHNNHTATLLPNGKVLVTGGIAELYDPAAGTWSTTGSMATPRIYHTATLLPNGKVLVAAGEGGNGFSVASAELYDPTTGTWTATGSMETSRKHYAAALLANGRVLAAGGRSGGGFGVNIASAEVYDPTTPIATPTPTITPHPTATPTASPTPGGATATPTPVVTATPTPSSTATPSATPSPGQAGNISTRLRVETGDNVLIGGFIVTGTQPKRVILRAIGPSLTAVGVPDALANPTLELHDSSGLLASNDNWMDAPNRQEIIDTTIAPTNDFESAILMTLPANNSAYTAIVRGVNNGTGVGLVEVYDLDSAADSKLANISTRGFVQTEDNVMIGGFIVVGQSSTRVIVRAIGPSLSVPGKLADPTLELRDGNGTLLQSDDNWRTGGQEAEIIATTIPPSDDLESAILRTLAPGNYTAIVRGVNDTTGVALVEAYDLGPP